MAFGRLERRRTPPPMSDINMTPLIDVMLVLLVIFMVTAPLMSSSLRLDLPSARGGTPPSTKSVLTVAVDAQGRLHLGDRPIAPKELEAAARSAAQANAATEVQLRADRAVPYGDVAALIGLLQGAGLNRIGFITQGGAATPAPAAPPDAQAVTPRP